MKQSNRTQLYVTWLVAPAVIIFIPIIVRSEYFTSVMILVALYGVLSIGMGILIGYGGMLSLAHPTWFGLGAYIPGILAAREILPSWLGIIAGAICVGLISFAIGAPVLRLRGYHLACATFAILLIAQLAGGLLTDITGGHEGLLGIPPLSIAGFLLETDLQFYYLSWALCIVCYWFCSNLIHSRVGRAIRSFHDSEIASKSMGVNIAKYKLQIFVLTAVMGSLAGSIFCFYLRFAVPESFGFSLLVELLMMVVIGGVGSLRGPLLGSLVILWLSELIHTYLGKVFPVMTSDVDAIFFGMMIIIVLIFMPRGMIGWIDQLLHIGKESHERFTSIPG